MSLLRILVVKASPTTASPDTAGGEIDSAA